VITPHLQYIAIPYTSPTTPLAARDLATTVVSLTAGYDAFATSEGFYYSWAATSAIVDVAVLTLSNISLNQIPTPVAIAGSHTASLISVVVNDTGLAGAPFFWISFWGGVSNNGYVASFSSDLAPVLAATLIISGTIINEITSVTTATGVTVFYETANTYGFTPSSGSTTKTDFISRVSITSAGSVGATTIILRGVGLASKAFTSAAGVIYMLATFGETNQPTYFLIDSLGNIYMRLAYSNGGGYESNQALSNVSLIGSTYFTPYLANDFLASVNKGTNLPANTPNNGIYTQTGINLAKFSINSSGQHSSEIAGALHLTGGQLWEYDGVRPVEHGFQVWPSNPTTTTNGSISTATGSGGLVADTYYYQFTYEWTDGAGNLHRSAPSIPISITTTTASSTNTIHVPTLRLTYKLTPNPVRIVGYRWSVLQQVYYQFTSLTVPMMNDTTIDYVTFTDTQASTAILGNVLLYTTGSVVENIAAPACIASALFKNRLFLIDAEDQNLLWFSKQVIENTPVEMSDLLTVYVAPTSGAQGSTGPMTALSAMDDKLIIFKKDAIYYLTGTGPDNTGANNDFSDPIFITSIVGCANPNSIVLTPNGVMFQSDKGIWVLGRDLQTQYIGAPVERYNSSIVYSAKAVPATNQVRFILNNNVTLMFDYYYNQWGTFNNISAISGTLYHGKDTYLNSFGKVLQETSNKYLDGSQPVLMSFTTSWLNLAGLQGYQRAYFFYLLGQYFSPHKLNLQISYDYNPSPSHSVLVSPTNYSPAYGGDGNDDENPYGQQALYGGPGDVEQWRVFLKQQRCQAFQITLDEIYDPSFGASAGAGLTLSGLNLVVALKKGFRPIGSAHSVGVT